LAALPTAQKEAVLDCTGGWYTRQVWEGVPLAEILQRAGVLETAVSVTIESVTRYRRRFSLADAQQMLLAYRVAGAPLAHGHGAPLRLVIPGKRGLEWVKWITAIQVNTTSALLQSPLPLS
jgi:DMSO/TMAO reductase YedYZ molybdopterin-dependent catalytic subunit